MSINEKLEKIKSALIPIVILFVGLISFGLGRLSAISERKSPVEIMNEVGLHSSNDGSSTSFIESSSASASLFVASKSGKKYHYPWCSGAQRIKESNKIWFNTKQEAEGAGYTPASNCKGL